MVSSYTANLAAFLTIESLSSPISNVEDLANADGAVPYGAKRGGSTFGFFKESENPTYQKMYEFMSTHPEHMTATNDEGLERAKVCLKFIALRRLIAIMSYFRLENTHF